MHPLIVVILLTIVPYIVAYAAGLWSWLITENYYVTNSDNQRQESGESESKNNTSNQETVWRNFFPGYGSN
jgi:hypothetical protein